MSGKRPTTAEVLGAVGIHVDPEEAAAMDRYVDANEGRAAPFSGAAVFPDDGTDRAEEAFALDARIRALKKVAESAFVELGRDLAVMRDRELFRLLGCETFEEYLARPELGLSRATAYIMIAAVDVVDRLSVPTELAAEIGHVKLSMIRAPIVAGRGETDAWLEDARMLSKTDLRRRIREAGVEGPATPEEAERAEDAKTGDAILSALRTGVDSLEYGRWAGLTVRCADGEVVKVRTSGETPLRVEIEKKS